MRHALEAARRRNIPVLTVADALRRAGAYAHIYLAPGEQGNMGASRIWNTVPDRPRPLRPWAPRSRKPSPDNRIAMPVPSTAATSKMEPAALTPSPS